MHKTLLAILVLFVIMSTACIRITVPDGNNSHPVTPSTPAIPVTPSNQQPVAYIDSVQPATASFGDSIAFSGRGSDIDGTVIGYEWRSNLDGVISTAPGFITSTLSVGTHTVSLKVIDNNSLWSEAATATVIITQKASRPVIEIFQSVPPSVAYGSAVELRWSVIGAKSVTIDNGVGPVTASGSMIIYPIATTSFTLTAVNEGGNAVRQITVVVQNTTVTGNPVINFTAQHLGGTSWRLNWAVNNASQAVIEPGIGPVTLTGSTVVTVPSGQTKIYKLTATNSWGWATWSVQMTSP